MERSERRSFTDNYKRKAVDLVSSSGRSIGSVVKELGLRDSVLRRWVERRGAGCKPTHFDSLWISMMRDAAETAISKWSGCTMSTMFRGRCATTLLPTSMISMVRPRLRI
jgi:hypothetical protein